MNAIELSNGISEEATYSVHGAIASECTRNFSEFPVPKKSRRVKKICQVATAVMAVVSFSRVAVLFLEAHSTVSAERNADFELLNLCSEGVAQQSSKMRGACLQAQADRASPIVLKAILRAVNTAWSEFSESASSPYKLALVALFVLSAFVLPVIPALRFVGQVAEESFTEDDEESHIVMLHDETFAAPLTKWRKALRFVRRQKPKTE